METIKKSIKNREIIDKRSYQFTLDRDINVPEHLGDISRIIAKNGSLSVSEEKCIGDKLYVSGSLFFQLLYYTEDNENSLAGLNGSIDFDEMIRISDEQSGTWKTSAKLEDVQITIIHPRKISVTALISIEPCCSRENESSLITAISEDEDVECLYLDKDVDSIIYSADDRITVNEELAVSPSDPNIGRIMYFSYVLNDFDCEASNGICTVYGKLSLFIIYSGEDTGKPYCIIEDEIPFKKEFEVENADSTCICFANPCINKVRLEPSADENGEQRLISVYAEIGCDSDVFREEKTLVLDDAYSVNGDLLITRTPESSRAIVGTEVEIIKFTERIKGEAYCEDFGESVHTDAAIDIDDLSFCDDGIHMAGTLKFTCVYKSLRSPDQLEVLTKDFDFMEKLPLPAVEEYETDKLHINLTAIPVSASLKPSPGGEIEGRADVKINYMVTADSENSFITDIEFNPCCGKCKKQITCYYIKDGDTLFSIGRHFKVRQSDMEKWNPDLSLIPGRKLYMYTCRKAE